MNNRTTTIATLGAFAAMASPAMAFFGAFPLLSNFAADLPGAPPATGGPNQPLSLVVPMGGSVLVQSSALGLTDQPLVLSDDDGDYVSANYGFPASSGRVRFEATVSVSDLVSGYFMQTSSPSGPVLSRLNLTPAGTVWAGGVTLGSYTPGVPQRYRIDTDMVAGTYSVAIDAELDGFADDPAVGGLPLVNVGQTEIAAALASFNVVTAASIAYDDIYVGNAEIGTPFCFGDGTAQPCPCGNASVSGEGCANSSGQGATATADGSTSATLDDLIIFGAQLPPGQPALLFSTLDGDEPGVVFGDGVRCTFSGVVRLQVRSAGAGGDLHFGPGLRDVGGWSQGDTRRMQIWYRDPVGPCAQGFNTSNALEVNFTL